MRRWNCFRARGPNCGCGLPPSACRCCRSCTSTALHRRPPVAALRLSTTGLKRRQWSVRTSGNYAYSRRTPPSASPRSRILVFDEDHLGVAVVQHVGQLRSAGANIQAALQRTRRTSLPGTVAQSADRYPSRVRPCLPSLIPLDGACRIEESIVALVPRRKRSSCFRARSEMQSPCRSLAIKSIASRTLFISLPTAIEILLSSNL